MDAVEDRRAELPRHLGPRRLAPAARRPDPEVRPQLRGPSIPQRFENHGRGGGYQLPQFDNAGQDIRDTEWGTVQSADNPNWGGERIVTGSDGSAYYSPTHYQTWIVIEAGR
ncbi:hypothetical protein GCM10022245_05300 [Streptomyces mayteni]